jgi:hypothetical protein
LGADQYSPGQLNSLDDQYFHIVCDVSSDFEDVCEDPLLLVYPYRYIDESTHYWYSFLGISSSIARSVPDSNPDEPSPQHRSKFMI